jgi:class 3 adenylate cyclase
MVETARVQYVFLDVVGFTKNRSIEAQSEIVAALNEIVIQSLQSLNVPKEDTVFLPTGDGIAIAMIEVRGFDINLRLSLEILRQIYEHNNANSDVMRNFEVRIGINENIDNVLIDINGRRNVAGAGISMAQRIMDKADSSQILVGSTVYEILRQREQYFSSFRAFTTSGKHGIKFSVYQFLAKNSPGLSDAVPSIFVSKKPEPIKLTKFAAYFIAHAASNRNFLYSRKEDATRNWTAIVLLYFLAKDSESASVAQPYDKPSRVTWNAGMASFEEQYDHYSKIEYWPLIELADLLAEKHLQLYSSYFEGDEWLPSYVFIKPSGMQKLITEWPQIANDFGIGHKNNIS